jgi:hypothetical protein
MAGRSRFSFSNPYTFKTGTGLFVYQSSKKITPVNNNVRDSFDGFEKWLPQFHQYTFIARLAYFKDSD